MHKRKHYLVYPPKYSYDRVPYKKYKVVYSRLQAWKLAYRMGEGSFVMVDIISYPRKRSMWDSSTSYELWEIVKGD